MSDYRIYQKSICSIPEFLNKYLDLFIMQRLKDISLFCGMDNASPYMYFFKYLITRYDHSLNVALITWKLTRDKTQTLAALFHDIGTPVFSHAIDYMNRDYKNQESTEEQTRLVLLSSSKLREYLKEDGVDIEDVINFKALSVVDLPRPCLCADRLENIIGVGMSWVNKTSLDEALEIIDNIYLTKNEHNQDEICFRNKYVAEYVSYINDQINLLTHSNNDTYMMVLLSDIVRRTIDEGYIIYDDLFRLTEPEYIKIIQAKKYYDSELADMWHTFRHVKSASSEYNITIKDMTLNPLVNDRRLREVKR